MSRMANIVVKDCGSERVVSLLADHLNDTGMSQSLSVQLASIFESAEGVSSLGDSEFAEDSEMETLTLDFGLVSWLSSVGLNELISINRQARTRGVRLVLANVQEPVRKVFALTRLERMFELSEPQAQSI